MQKLKDYLNILNYSNQYEKLINYYNLLVEKNKQFNLTTVIDKYEAEIKHFIDSLQSVDFIKEKQTILDIGSGAGFPSIVLAIVKENNKFNLIETVGKKSSFLIEVAEKLQLKNMEVKNCRIEDLYKNNKFDIVTARALANLPTLLEYALPYLKINGILIAYKGSNFLEEIEESKNALEQLGGKIKKIKEYTLYYNNENYKRALVIIEKIKECPNKYPRKNNKPRTRPL